MADEAGFLELLIANERIGRALDVLCDPYQRSKHSNAISQLQQDLQKGASYVEEANRLGAVKILTKLLSTTSDEATLDQLSNMIALCSGPMACGGKASTFSYGPLAVHVHEGALGDGLGAKVWAVCHIMVRELLAHPEIFKGQQVLELGSGTGLVGLVAALAGAQQVVLTDHEDKVLLNLRTCMHMNAAHSTPAAATSTQPAAAAAGEGTPQQQCQHEDQHQVGAPNSNARQQQQQQQQQQQGLVCVPTDAELFDDAEYVEDFDLGDFISDPTPTAAAAGGDIGATSAAADGSSAAAVAAGVGAAVGSGVSAAVVAAAERQTAWEAANMLVRLLDWQESEDALLQHEQQQQQGVAHQEAPPHHHQQQQETLTSTPQHTGGASGLSAPHVPLSQRFPVILGNEVMYEKAHARLVAAAIKHRLAAGGRVLLCCAVRDQGVFDAFRDTCSRWGLRYRAARVQPQSDEELGGIVGRERDYEGGYLLMAVDHAAAPAGDWHRDDFGPVN